MNLLAVLKVSSFMELINQLDLDYNRRGWGVMFCVHNGGNKIIGHFKVNNMLRLQVLGQDVFDWSSSQPRSYKLKSCFLQKSAPSYSLKVATVL